MCLVVLTVVSSSNATAQAPPDSLYRRAIELIASGEYDSALSLLEGKLSSHVSDHRHQYLIGVCKFSLGNYPESVRALEVAFRGDSSSTAYSLTLGKAYAALNLLPAARRMLERAMDIDGSSLAARFELLRILCMQKQFDDAKNILARNPTQTELLVIGKALLSANRNTEALEYATQALAMDSASFPSRLLLANALFATQQYDNAFVHYAELMLENQHSAEVARKLAFCYEKQGSTGIPTAILMMQKYLRLTGDTTAADLARIGSWFYLRQRYDSSAAYYRLAAMRDSTSAEVRFNYGLALYRLGRLHEAERELRGAEQLFAPTVLFQSTIARTIGAVLLQRKAFANAIAYYQKALRSDPSSHEAMYGLAASYDSAGRSSIAIRWYKKYLSHVHHNKQEDQLAKKVKARLKELGEGGAVLR